MALNHPLFTGQIGLTGHPGDRGTLGFDGIQGKTGEAGDPGQFGFPGKRFWTFSSYVLCD